MDRKAIIGAVVAAAFVGIVFIGRIALSRLEGKELSTKAATFGAIAIVALIGLVAGSGLLERILGW